MSDQVGWEIPDQNRNVMKVSYIALTLSMGVSLPTSPQAMIPPFSEPRA